jgi:hypothetical protein
MELQSIQIALFFKDILLNRPDLTFRDLSENLSTIFDKMPTIFPIPNEAPHEIPFMILSSQDNLTTCNISRSRIDFLTTNKDLMKNETILENFIDEVCKARDIIQFGFVSTHFKKTNNATDEIKQKFLKSNDSMKDLSIRYNKPIRINKELFNYHFSISDIKQQNINTNSTEEGLLIQRDINNITLNLKNEIFVHTKLKSIFKNSFSILYSSEIND